MTKKICRILQINSNIHVLLDKINHFNLKEVERGGGGVGLVIMCDAT